ncbi:MAG: hypothetical protein MZW92_58820 [Comamonadaceae bacterium]|nr:hypothetical protein [Comamonadaceae bacterium]
MSYLIPPTFTAKHDLPAAPAAAERGQRRRLASSARLPGWPAREASRARADQYVALMQSDHGFGPASIDKFGLMQAYGAKYRFEARETLSKNVRITLGKKDGLISRRGRRPERGTGGRRWPTNTSPNCGE